MDRYATVLALGLLAQRKSKWEPFLGGFPKVLRKRHEKTKLHKPSFTGETEERVPGFGFGFLVLAPELVVQLGPFFHKTTRCLEGDFERRENGTAK